MYALNESLAIDGKAMYFGEKIGLRTLEFGPRRWMSKFAATGFTDSYG
jgi:hypothetical protein